MAMTAAAKAHLAKLAAQDTKAEAQVQAQVEAQEAPKEAPKKRGRPKKED